MDLLFTFNSKYIAPFKTLITSLRASNSGHHLRIWLTHSSLKSNELKDLSQWLEMRGIEFHAIVAAEKIFANAPVMKQYPKEMYYRLLAGQLLPATLHRVLYLDPDILVINSLDALWNYNLDGAAFAAASHSWGPDLVHEINRIRLDTDHDYFNTGVMLMDLDEVRQLVDPEAIFSFVHTHRNELLLPDQDVFNALFGRYTLQIDDTRWNYDVRYFKNYQLKSSGLCTLDWVMENSSILHFCGKKKPWHKQYSNRFGVLYKHYRNLSQDK